MSIYAIGDLHLSLDKEKPMNIFGDNWNNHENKIRENWTKIVEDNDLVLIPGDFSWAMNLKEMYEDFKYLNTLPGKKLLLKGNHDYWWTTLTSMRNFLKENNFKNIDFIYNNSYEYEDKIIAGTRGWTIGDTDNSKKMNNREQERLKISLQDGINKYGEKDIICLMHYPPLSKGNIPICSLKYEDIENEESNNVFENSEYIDIMKKYNVITCLYGHLHGKSHEKAFEGIYKGIEFKLVSCDYLDFKLYKVVK